MNNLTTIDNQVWDEAKPEKTDALASRCLDLLLKGKILNRKTLDEMDITANNSSLHSLISILRNERFIPIMSHRQEDWTCDYYMTEREIERFHNPILRNQQREHMRSLVERKRIKKVIFRFNQLLDLLSKLPDFWMYLEPNSLEKVVENINALLENKKGVK